MAKEPINGDGWAVSSIDDLGDGPGFRKVRGPLGITAFGVNAIVLPPRGYTPRHSHERQEELYLVLDGEIEIDLGEHDAHARPGRPRARQPRDDALAAQHVGCRRGHVLLRRRRGRLRRP